jgi:hypothetical protein
MIPSLDIVDDMVILSKFLPKKGHPSLQHPKFKLELKLLSLVCPAGAWTTRKSISTGAPHIGGGSCAGNAPWGLSVTLP